MVGGLTVFRNRAFTQPLQPIHFPKLPENIDDDEIMTSFLKENLGAGFVFGGKIKS